MKKGFHVNTQTTEFSTKPSKFQMFVCGLHPDVSESTLKSYFSQYTQVKNCKLAIDKQTGKSRCFGFVTLSSDLSHTDILSRRHAILGKPIECMAAMPRVKRQQDDGIECRIFVGGLPLSARDEDLKVYFKAFGEVKEYKVKSRYAKRVSRGFGFVVFRDMGSAQRVLQRNDHFICGKWVECKQASKRGDLEVEYKSYCKTESTESEECSVAISSRAKEQLASYTSFYDSFKQISSNQRDRFTNLIQGSHIHAYIYTMTPYTTHY